MGRCRQMPRRVCRARRRSLAGRPVGHSRTCCESVRRCPGESCGRWVLAGPEACAAGFTEDHYVSDCPACARSPDLETEECQESRSSSPPQRCNRGRMHYCCADGRSRSANRSARQPLSLGARALVTDVTPGRPSDGCGVRTPRRPGALVKPVPRQIENSD